MQGKEALIGGWWECKLAQSLGKSPWKFLEIELPLAHLGIYQGGYKINMLQRCLPGRLYPCTIHNTKATEPVCMFIHR